MSRAWKDVLGGVRQANYGYRAFFRGATAEEGGLTGVWSVGRSRVATDTPSEPAHSGSGIPGRGNPPLRPNLSVLFPEIYVAALVPGCGLPGRGL